MSQPGSRRWWIVAFLACWPLAACNDSAPEESTAGKPAAAVPRNARVTENMVAAVFIGKASPAIGVYFQLGSVPAVDTALPVDVAILPHQDFSSIQARFSAPADGLTLVSGDILAPFANAKAETALQHKLVVMPRKEGVYMLTVNLETQGSEGSVSRIFSIPVIVAAPASAAAQAPAAAQPAPAAN